MPRVTDISEDVLCMFSSRLYSTLRQQYATMYYCLGWAQDGSQPYLWVESGWGEVGLVRPTSSVSSGGFISMCLVRLLFVSCVRASNTEHHSHQHIVPTPALTKPKPECRVAPSANYVWLRDKLTGERRPHLPNTACCMKQNMPVLFGTASPKIVVTPV